MTQIAILNSLAAVRRRVRLLSFLHGLGKVFAVAIAAVLAVVLLDYSFDLPPVLRILLLIGAAFAIVYFAAKSILFPLTAKLGISDIAGRVEQAFPAFDDRLRSTVDFAKGEAHGSEAMKRRVIDQATEIAGRVDLKQVVQPRPAWKALAIALASMMLCAILALAVGPEYVHAALARLFDPFAPTAWPKRTLIALADPLPQRIAAGTPLELRIKLVKGDSESKKALVWYQYEAGGPITQEWMTRGEDGTYTASLDSRLEPGQAVGSIIVGVKSGDDSHQWPAVQIVPPLILKHVQAIVSPPPYAVNAPIKVYDLSAAPATVTLGSKVEIQAAFSKPLSDRAPHLVAIDSPLPSVQWKPSFTESTVALGGFIATQATDFHLIASDQDGFSNSGIEEFQLLVKPDQPPSIQFEKPQRDQECTPDATIPIQAMAEDDFGIRNVEMGVTRIGDKKSWTISMVHEGQAVDPTQWTALDSTEDQVRFRLNRDWELSSLDSAALKPGDALEFYLRAQDNFVDPQGHLHNPPCSESGRLRVDIISQDQFSEELSDQLSQLRNSVDQTLKANESLRSGTATLRGDTANKANLDRADRAAAAQLANDQSAAASQAKQIADKLGEMLQRMAQNKAGDQDMANSVADAQRLLNDAAENAMKQAAQRLSDMADPQNRPSTPERNNSLDQAQQNQAAASAQLKAAMQKMGDDSGVSQFLKTISALLNAQRDLSGQTAQRGSPMLGKQQDQLSDPERKALNDLARKQQELARQTEQAMQQMSKSADQQQRNDPSSSQALRQAAQTGQQQNVSGQMQQAAQAERQNQQADAQSGQRQAELGLMMIQDELRQAENRRLMQLVRDLETAQELVADLLQQQAEHNLDNLLLQGKPALAKAINSAPELLADAYVYSGRDPKDFTTPALATQIALQEQTERNTRNIVPTIQQLPEGADPAADLTKAAQRMTRAIAYMQDSQLADAYSPPQTEAFAALLGAKEELDRQAQSAQQKMQDQQRESLRERFVQAKEAQLKLNQRTVAIDNTPRTSDGQLGHTARATIGILSNDQADLGKRTAQIDSDLSAMGSIAYSYANADIASKMSQVSLRLAALDPGKSTRHTQDRVVSELDDMIKDLSIKPRQSRFANPRNSQSNGGGQQGGQMGPRLPSEAEIRLIQDMQKLLNQDTKDADAAGDATNNKASVIDLGKRQGDLRNLLDHLLQKSSNGQTSLGPEPANKPSLPEEATDEDLDLQELKDSALNAKPDAQSIGDGTQMLGIRMGRAHQRLATHADPGETTQKIQERIVIELDALAKMAQEQEQNAAPSSAPRPSRPGQGQPQPNPGQNPGNAVANGQRNQQRNGSRPAPRNASGPPLEGVDISATIAQMKDSWGRLSPRQRAAVMEGASDQTLQKFKDFVDGYYRTLADTTNNNNNNQ